MSTNQFINPNARITVVLFSFEGQRVAEGMIEGKILSTAHLLKHNERYYYFNRVNGSTEIYFRECQQPYTITEF